MERVHPLLLPIGPPHCPHFHLPWTGNQRLVGNFILFCSSQISHFIPIIYFSQANMAYKKYILGIEGGSGGLWRNLHCHDTVDDHLSPCWQTCTDLNINIWIEIKILIYRISWGNLIASSQLLRSIGRKTAPCKKVLKNARQQRCD